MAKTRRSTTTTSSNPSHRESQIDEKEHNGNDHNEVRAGIEEGRLENEEEEETRSPYSSQTITLSTFVHLLGLYPKTVEAVTRWRVGERGVRGKKTMTKKKKEEEGQKEKEEEEEHNQLIDVAVEGFLELDRWRYEGVGCAAFAFAGWYDSDDDDLDEEGEEKTKKKKTTKTKEKNGCHGYADREYLTKDEVVRLMEWKLQHGVSRPALMGMIKSNPPRTVEQATRAALAALPGGNLSQQQQQSHGRGEKEEEEFPQTSLNELTTPLRGVGVATASLILSAATSNSNREGIPFFNDDVYLWLCIGEVPRLRDELASESAERARRRKSHYKRLGGELALKYNMKEYQGLWDGVRALRGRLLSEIDLDGEDKEGKGTLVSCASVEKVAFVLRHVEFAGLGEELVSVDRACLGVEMGNVEKKRELVEESMKEGMKKRLRKG